MYTHSHVYRVGCLKDNSGWQKDIQDSLESNQYTKDLKTHRWRGGHATFFV